jgi:hypothetical protein
MTIVKLNARNYARTMHGRGIYGKYSKIRTQSGYGIVDALGKNATKMILGGLGKTTGAFAGKQLGKFVTEKTGSKLAGKAIGAVASSLAGMAGNRLGSTAGKFIGNTVFDDKKKKPAAEGRVSLAQLLDNARKQIGAVTSGQSGSGIMLNY